MSTPTEYAVPSAPPVELLAELDAAARSLDALSARAAELTLEMDEETGKLRIQLEDVDGSRRLTPRQLFELLSPTP